MQSLLSGPPGGVVLREEAPGTAGRTDSSTHTVSSPHPTHSERERDEWRFEKK